MAANRSGTPPSVAMHRYAQKLSFVQWRWNAKAILDRAPDGDLFDPEQVTGCDPAHDELFAQEEPDLRVWEEVSAALPTPTESPPTSRVREVDAAHCPNTTLATNVASSNNVVGHDSDTTPLFPTPAPQPTFPLFSTPETPRPALPLPNVLKSQDPDHQILDIGLTCNEWNGPQCPYPEDKTNENNKRQRTPDESTDESHHHLATPEI
jgi:hypothetical protein